MGLILLLFLGAFWLCSWGVMYTTLPAFYDTNRWRRGVRVYVAAVLGLIIVIIWATPDIGVWFGG
jgi:hypothetical protein